MRRGTAMSDATKQRCIQLLRDTELNMEEIATRLDLTRSTIRKINHKNHVRIYTKKQFRLAS